MTIWTPRNLTIMGAVIAAGGLMLGGSIWTDMLVHRASIQTSAEATCADPTKDCAQKDLPAQVRAATAAEAMADLTFWQSILGTIGLMVGGATLLAAARAAHWAKEAAEHTKRSADIAEKSLDAADAPFLLVSSVEIDPLNAQKESLEYGFKITNYGKGPALITAYAFSIRSTKPPLPDDMRIKADLPAHWPLAPNAWWGIEKGPNTGVQIPEAERKAILSGELVLCALGTVEYTDVKGNPLTHRFAYIYRPDGFVFVPVSDGKQWQYR